MKIKAALIVAIWMTLINITFAAPSTWDQSVTYNGETITMRLKKVSIRGSNFEVRAYSSANNYNTITPVARRSYIGTVDGHPGAVSAGILRDDGTFWGFIAFDREDYAEMGSTWITVGNTVQTPLPPFSTTPQTFNFPLHTVQPAHIGNTTYGYDVGVDLSYTYYSGPANFDVHTALEMVEYSFVRTTAIYLRDIQLRPYLGRVVIHTSSNGDPFTGQTDARNYLDAVMLDWETDHANSNWDMVVGVSTDLLGLGGLADPDGSIVLTDSHGDFGLGWRHEMGHSWWLGHWDGASIPKQGPEGGTINSNNGYSRFSGSEVARMLHRRDDRLAGFDNVSLQSEGVFNAVDLPPYAALDRVEYRYGIDAQVTIDATANDHDANGDNFNIISHDPITAMGGAVIRQGQQLIYAAPNTFIGTDYFMYTIEDSSGQTAQGVVLVKVDLNDDLRLHFSLDENSGTVAHDDSLYMNDGDLNSVNFSSASVPGQFGRAIDLDGVFDHIDVSGVDLGSDTVTYTAWLKPGDNQNQVLTGIIFTEDPRKCGLIVSKQNELQYYWDERYWEWFSGLKVPQNTWTFVALTIDPFKATMYMNTGSGFQSSVHHAAHAGCNLSDIRVGGAQLTNGKRHFDGAIDDVRIYAYTLSQAELQDLYDGDDPTGGSSSPVFTSDPINKANAIENVSYTGQTLAVNATDADNDPLSFSKTFGPAWLNVASNGTLSGTPGADNVGINTFTVRVDATDGSDTATLQITVDAAGGGGGTTVSLRNGSNGYNGMVDATIRSDNATTNYGSANTIESDGTPDYAGLLKWDLTAIPPGSTVANVTLGVQVSNISDSSYEIYGLKKTWNESQVTWNQAANGSNWQTPGANGNNDRSSSAFTSITAPSLGWYDLQLNAAGVAQVQSWIDNPSSNHGFIILDYTNTNGLDIYSSEHDTVNQRPLLTITYTEGGTSGSAPAFDSDPITLSAATEAVPYSGQTLADLATDADGDGLSFFKDDGPDWLNVAANGSLSGTPGANDIGTNTWTVRVTDGIDGSDTATLEITVQPAAQGSNDSCPGIDLGDVSDAAVPATVSNSIQKGSDDADYFSVTATQNGTLTLTQTPTNGRFVSFSVGTVCDSDNLFARTNSRGVKTVDVDVTAGQTIYFWMDTSGYSNTNLREYDISFAFTGSGVTEPSYPSSQGNDSDFEWIAAVNIGSINRTSGTDGGYYDATATSMSAAKGSSVAVALTPGFDADGPYNEVWRVWIDLNHDGDFTDANEEVFAGSGQSSVSGNFTLPASYSYTGATRMRVAMRYQSAPPSDANFDYGEVEDYTIIINP